VGRDLLGALGGLNISRARMSVDLHPGLDETVKQGRP
jgi:hypothetical protein